MSYEHCDRHNRDATNGCETCYGEQLTAKQLKLQQAALAYAAAPGGDPITRDLLETAAHEFAFADLQAKGDR